jgi:hypothetical protein
MYRGQMEFKHFHYLRNMMLGVKPAEYYINKIRKARKVSQRERELLLLYWKLNQIIFVSEHKTLELAYSKPMGMDEIFRAKIRNYNKLEQKRAKQRAYNSTMRGRRR